MFSSRYEQLQAQTVPLSQQSHLPRDGDSTSASEMQSGGPRPSASSSADLPEQQRWSIETLEKIQVLPWDVAMRSGNAALDLGERSKLLLLKLLPALRDANTSCHGC